MKEESPAERQAIPTWPGEIVISPEEQQERLERLADALVKRHLGGPAILFLESVRPLNFIGSQFLLSLIPLLNLVTDPRDIQTIYCTLERRQGMEHFLTLIEQYEQKR